MNHVLIKNKNLCYIQIDFPLISHAESRNAPLASIFDRHDDLCQLIIGNCLTNLDGYLSTFYSKDIIGFKNFYDSLQDQVYGRSFIPLMK